MMLSKSQEGTESCSFLGFVGKKVIYDQSMLWAKKPTLPRVELTRTNSAKNFQRHVQNTK